MMRKAACSFFASAVLLSLALAGCSSDSIAPTSSAASSGAGGGGGSGPDPLEFAAVQASCAYECPASTCPELTAPYACQNLLPWNEIPHDPACGAWDGTAIPPKAGKCTASAPSGEAIKFTGPDPADPKVTIMPDGRRLTPAGADFEFPDPRSMTSNVITVPGTSLVLTVDTGYGDHLVRAVDTAKIGQGDPTLSQIAFVDPEALNEGIAFSPPDRVFVATAQGKVQAISLDQATGVLLRDDARSIALPPSVQGANGSTDFYVSGVAVSADNTRLFVSGVEDKRLLVVDVTAGGPGYGAVLGQVELGAAETFGVYADPSDPATHFVYVSMWADRAVR